jgi:hypothetical protein
MKISFKKPTLYLRVFGAALAIAGGLILWIGGKELSLDLYGGAAFSLPLEYLFIVIGLTLGCMPLVVVYFLALILPDKFEERLLNFADSVDPEYNKLKQNPNPQTVTTILQHHIHRSNKRSYTFILIGVVFVFLILPWLVTQAISSSDSRRESERLVSLVQETRIDFSSGDHIRERLHEAEGRLASSATATSGVYDALKHLYDPSIKNPADFEKAINVIYETQIKPNVSETGLLRDDAFRIKRSSSQARLAPAAYLTLLATVCNTVGDNGKHVDPYLQGRQLLRLAFNYFQATDNVPASHNMAGVNYAGLLKAYGSLEEKFKDEHLAQKVQSALDINGIPSQLSLLRMAKAEYVLAEQQSPSNLAKARSLNNQVDVLLTFLSRIHLEGRLDPEIIRDETDRRFLEDEFAIKMPDKTVDHQQLIEILNRFRTNLTEALKLSRDPEIFYTRAQLFSIGGELSEKYKLNLWGGSDSIAQMAVTDLHTAASMQMPARLFEKADAQQFYLAWLWRRPNMEIQLEQLAHP